MPRFATPFTRALVIATGVALTPQVAHACVYNWMEGFSPAPECHQRDLPGLSRLIAVNMKIAGKLTTIAAKSAMVAEEIRGWTYAYQEARRYEDRLQALVGDITADPLPSLVAQFNETGLPMHLNVGANGTLTLNPVLFDASGRAIPIRGLSDLRQVADDAIARNLIDSTGFRRLFNDATDLREHGTSVVFLQSRLLQDQLRGVLEYRQRANPLRDSLKAFGLRNAARYSLPDAKGHIGTPEARLNYLAATLGRLRTSGMMAQSRSIQARTQSAEAALRARAENRDFHARRAPSAFRF